MEPENAILARAKTLNSFPVPTSSIKTEPAPSTGADYSDARAAVIKQKASAATAQEEANKFVAATNSATDVITKSLRDISTSDQVIDKVSQTATMEAQNNTYAAFEASGGNEIQQILMKNLSSQITRVNELDAKMDEIRTTKSSDNMLVNAIINGWNALPVKQELNDATADYNRTVAQIQGVTQSTESVASANIAVKRDVNQATIKANWDRTAAVAKVKMTEAQLQGLRSNAEARTTALNMDGRALDAELSLLRLDQEAKAAVVREQELEIRKQTLEFQKEQMLQAREDRPLELKKLELAVAQAEVNLANGVRNADIQYRTSVASLEAFNQDNKRAESTREEMTASINAGEAILGVPLSSSDYVINSFKNGGPQEAKMVVLDQVGRSGQIGTTPAEVRNTLKAVFPTGNPNQNRLTKALRDVERLQSADQAALAKTDPNYKAPRSKEDDDANFNMYAEQYYRSSTGVIKEGDNSNPYHAPPFSIIAESKAVQQTKLYQNLLKQKGFTEFNPKAVLDTALAGIAAKTISAAEAAEGITVIAKAIIVDNNRADGGFARYGLKSQRDYNIEVPIELTATDKVIKAGTASIFSFYKQAYEGFSSQENQVVNLADEAQVKQVLIKMFKVYNPTEDTSKEGVVN